MIIKVITLAIAIDDLYSKVLFGLFSLGIKV
jgi:hypothetical protein